MDGIEEFQARGTVSLRCKNLGKLADISGPWITNSGWQGKEPRSVRYMEPCRVLCQARNRERLVIDFLKEK